MTISVLRKTLIGKPAISPQSFQEYCSVVNVVWASVQVSCVIVDVNSSVTAFQLYTALKM